MRIRSKKKQKIMEKDKSQYLIETNKDLMQNMRKLCFKNGISFERFIEYILFKIEQEDPTTMALFKESVAENQNNDIGLYVRTRIIKTENFGQNKYGVNTTSTTGTTSFTKSSKNISSDMIYEMIEQEFKDKHLTD